MPTRNLVLLIIVLILITLGVFAFIYLRAPNENPAPTEGTNFIASWWPFGKTDTPAGTEGEEPADISGAEPGTDTEIPASRLRKISSMPVAGYGVFMKDRYGATAVESVPFIRYADRATGNIFQTFADSIDERKFSGTPVPALREARFGKDGEGVIMRYLEEDGKTIATFAGILPKEILGGDTTAEMGLAGSFMPENISDLSVSPDASKMFYILPAGIGVAGITADLSGASKSQIFDSPFTEWLSSWPNDRMITITTKPASVAPGYMYSIDPSTKNVEKVLGGVKGLTTLTSPNGKLVLYSDNMLSLKIFDRDSGKAMSVGVKTLPEKCVWTKSSSAIYCAVPTYASGSGYPDNWYRGEVSFDDEIWKIDAYTGNGSLLVSPEESVDAVNLSLDDGEKYLFFMDKTDPYLWELSL